MQRLLSTKPVAKAILPATCSVFLTPSFSSTSQKRPAPPRSRAPVKPKAPPVSRTPIQSPPQTPSITRAVGGGTWTSSHFKIDPGEVDEFVERKSLVSRQAGSAELALRDCPTCPPTKNQPTNFFKLYISKENGTFFCHRCGNKGSWFDFKKLWSSSPPSVESLSSSSNSSSKPTTPPKEITEKSQIASNDLWGSSPEALRAREFLTQERGLDEATIRAYRVGLSSFAFQKSSPGKQEWTNESCLTFPWISADGKQSVRLKARSLDVKSNQRLHPPGGGWGLFGMHLVPPDAKEIVLTEGEFDAMAVYQATGRPAVSLPNGAHSLPLDILPQLERFERVVLWMDQDVAGQQGAEKFAAKLGRARVAIVSGDGLQGSKDANDALRAGVNMEHPIADAEPMPHAQIATFDELREEVYRELAHPDQVAGVQSTTLPGLNRLLKGLRMGELTVLTGATGVGKTTMLSQISLDYAQSDVPTLWGSFEIKNTRLAKKMLTQFARKDLTLPLSLEEFPHWADAFSELPLYFLRYFGSTNVDEVLDAMEYAVYRYDVQHVIIDNLQFMMSGQAVGSGRFDALDRALEQFRAFATSKNIHVTLVIHPRKVDDSELLETASVFGSAKATQEADNVVILQKGRAYRYLDVRKNRFDGDVGRIPVRFDKDTTVFTELSEDDVAAMEEAAEEARALERAERRGRYGGGGGGGGGGRSSSGYGSGGNGAGAGGGNDSGWDKPPGGAAAHPLDAMDALFSSAGRQSGRG